MDGKSDKKRPGRRSRLYKSLLSPWKDRKQIGKFLQTHKSRVFSGILSAVLLVLMFGIFSHLQSPVANDAPDGETALPYATLVAQVIADNVLAVLIRGNEVNVLLEHTLAGNGAPLSASQKSAQIPAWPSSASSGSTATWGLQVPSNIDAGRLVYTTIPANGAGQLLPLLLAKHVVVN